MFEITMGADGVVSVSGRFDASQVDKARDFLFSLTEGKTLDFSRLDYISSAGLGVLLAAQKRLNDRGHGLRIINLNNHIRDIFHFSGFDQIFEME